MRGVLRWATSVRDTSTEKGGKTRKLQVGVFLRTGKMDAVAGKAAEDLRERLEELRDALLANDLDKAMGLLGTV